AARRRRRRQMFASLVAERDALRAELAEIRADRDELRERLMELCDAICGRQAAEPRCASFIVCVRSNSPAKPCATPASRCSEMSMSDRERQLWTKFVCERERRSDGKRAKKRRPREGVSSPAELEAALDDLLREAEANGIGRATRQEPVASTSLAQK